MLCSGVSTFILMIFKSIKKEVIFGCHKEMKRLISYKFLMPHSCFYCTSSVPPHYFNLKHFDLIKDFTGGSPKNVQRALVTNMDLQLLDEKTVCAKLNFLIKEFKLADLNSLRIIPFLSRHPSRLKNRYQALCEYGIYPHEISTALINRFMSLCKMPVWRLKENYLIEKDLDVLQNLWKAAELPLENCPIVDDETTLYSLKAITIKAYLKEKLGIPDEIITKKEKEFLFRLQNKSFKTMNTNYYIFKDIIGLSKRRMAKNWFILYVDPDNVMDTLTRIKKVANMDVKDCLHVYPKIAAMTPENLENIIQYVQDAGIPLNSLQRCLKILTLNCETVNSRLKELKNYEYFSYNLRSPRILEAVHYLVKAKKHLKISEQLKLNTSLGQISSNEKNFERICLTGGKPSGIDCLHYLQAELDMKKHELVKTLKRHPRWTFVPLVHVGRNLQNLRKTFSDDEIRKNIYILFYYSEKLNMELKILNSHEGLDFFRENGTVKKEYILPLVLYFLEKESNFTGESVWDIETNPYQDLPDPMELLKSCS